MSDLIERIMGAEMPEEERARLVKVMRRISRRSDLHGVINANTGALSDSPDAALLLLQVLKNSAEVDWRQRTAALIALRWLPAPPEDSAETARVIGAILLGSDATIGERLAMRGFLIISRWLVGLLLLLLMVGLAALLRDVPLLADWLLSLTAIYAMLFLISTLLLPLLSPLYDATRAGDVRAEAAKTLAKLQMPESVKALARASRHISLGQEFVRGGLMRILPTLTEAQYKFIGADATPELCALLTHSIYDAPYAKTILAAIGKVGDGRAVRTVEKLANLRRESPLRDQAAALLPILTARREQENHAALLLRGSSAPPVEAGELLRPASSSAPTPPETLLRPAPEPPSHSA